MLKLTTIQKWFIKQGKLRLVPPVIMSTILSIIPHVGGDDYLQWAGLQSIDLMLNPLIGLVLVIATLAYFALVYQKEWFGFTHKTRFQKWFRIFSFAFLGLAATLLPFYLGVGNYFFGAMDMMAGGHNSQSLLAMIVWTGAMGFMLNDMFVSMDGKSGIIFRMPKINCSPMKDYSSIDYKIKRYFSF